MLRLGVSGHALGFSLGSFYVGLVGPGVGSVGWGSWAHCVISVALCFSALSMALWWSGIYLSALLVVLGVRIWAVGPVAPFPDIWPWLAILVSWLAGGRGWLAGLTMPSLAILSAAS